MLSSYSEKCYKLSWSGGTIYYSLLDLKLGMLPSFWHYSGDDSDSMNVYVVDGYRNIIIISLDGKRLSVIEDCLNKPDVLLNAMS